jgi:hypothetical protein
LPGAVVPRELFETLEDPEDAAQSIPFTRKLSNENRDTLMFVVRFIQEMVKSIDPAGPRAGMAQALVTWLASAVIERHSRDSETSRLFLTALVDWWKTDAVVEELPEVTGVPQRTRARPRCQTGLALLPKIRR